MWTVVWLGLTVRFLVPFGSLWVCAHSWLCAHSPFQAEAPAAVGLNAEVQGKQSCLFQVPSPVCIAYGVWPHFCSIIISLVIVDC